MQLAIKEETIKRLDEIAQGFQLAQVEKSPFMATFSTAMAITELRSLLTKEVMRPIMGLMNTPLGFLTDRTGRANWKGETKPLYGEDVIRDVIIEATLRGFFPVGNEFNVIADRFYAAKAGLRRKVSTFPGLTNFRETLGVPKIAGDSGAIVEARATWTLNGVDDSIERVFAVKGDKYAGADSYLGKATRKLLAAVLERISGQSVPEGEAGEADLETMKPAQGREVNHDSPHERAMERWRMDCEATEAINAKMREQGASEDQLEPMPPRPEPGDDDQIPGLDRKAKVPEPEPVPWRETVIQGIQGISGKKLGELTLAQLEKVAAAIRRMSPAARKPALAELLERVAEGIAELTPKQEEPKRATPLEGPAQAHGARPAHHQGHGA